MQSIPQTQKERAREGTAAPRLGTRGDTATSRWHWLLIPQNSPGSGRARSTHSIAGS